MKLDLNEYTTFGNLLQKLRAEKAITARKLCEELNISPAYLCDIEKGNRKPPNHQTLEKVIEFFNIDESQKNELLELIYLEKNQMSPRMIKFLTNNKQARQILDSLMQIKDFDKAVQKNPKALEYIEQAILSLKENNKNI